MSLRIRYYGDPILRQKAQPVEELTPEILNLVKEMIQLARRHNGWGLAAPQVGHSVRIFVAAGVTKDEDGHLDPTDQYQAYINPILSSPSEAQWTQREACFSVPGVYPDITRPVKIHVEAMDIHGNIFHQDIDGMPARIIMHENDHLNGVLLFDRASPKQRKSVEPLLRRIKKKYQ